MEKLWFKRKSYGWGWTPCTWQGWVIVLVWVIFFSTAIVLFDHEGLKNILFIILSTGLLIYICYKKGEKPKWQWGSKKD